MLVIGDGELLQGEYRVFALLPRHAGGVVVGTQRKQYLLLHGSLLGDLLVHDFERDEVDVERHVGLVAQFRMEVQQSVVRIQPFEQVLNTEGLAADVLHRPLVLLVNGFHDEPYQHRAFASEFLEIDFHGVVRTVYALPIVDEVRHFHIE